MEDQPYPPMAKGKRTKRQKPHSPTPFEMVPGSLSTTEEEEDMANCLILLAQGQSKATTSPEHTTNAGNIMNKEDEHYYYYPPPQQQQQQQPVKYNSKRYLETVTAAGGNKAGYYVYECKTCNRTFPSFQALGGHRASHKKPKIGGDHAVLFPSVQEKKQLFTLLPPSSSSDHLNSEDQGGHFRKTSSLSLHLSHNHGNSSKVHECSICGAEFMSGQALGGHMRRHRAPPNNLYTNKSPIIVGSPNITTLSLTPLIDKLELETQERQHTAEDKEVLSLDLDLNLPASGQEQDTTAAMGLPENSNKLQQIDNHTKKTSQPSSSSSAKVFSASPTLVDCHY